MGHFAEIAFRDVTGIAGAVVLFYGWTLTEDEHGKLQNILENWWKNVRDAQTSALSRHEVFMSRVAESVGRTFDRLFGERLFSVRAAGVSICYSSGTYSLLVTAMYCLIVFSPSWRLRFGHGVPASPGPELVRITLQVAATAFGFFALGSVPVLIHDRRSLRLWAWGSLAAVVALMGDVLIPGGAAGGVIADLAFAGSYACDVVFIAATRWVLRWRWGRQSNFRLLALLTFNCALAYFLAIPVVFGHLELTRPLAALITEVFALQVSPRFLSMWLPFVGVLNAVDVLVSVVAFGLALALLVHRVLWPIVHRPLYAIAKSTGARQKTFVVAGLALLSVWHPAIWHYLLDL